MGRKNIFQQACQDVARLTSVLMFDSKDLLKPREQQTKLQNVQDQGFYYWSAFYLGVFGGFVPYFFKLLPFALFQVWSVLNTLFRQYVLSPILMATGYGETCDWTGKNKPGNAQYTEEDLQPYPAGDTTRVARLATLDMLDPDLEKICAALFKKHAALMPHSQANPNFISGFYHIFVDTTFPGNFFDHLVGVWKVLQAWGQPRYVCRGGFFHSVYGTNQYRNYLWKYTERKTVQDLIGVGAEELGFLICTAERGALNQDLCEAMYGSKEFKQAPIRIFGARKAFRAHRDSGEPMTARLGEEGFPVTNHVTRRTVVFPPKTFAAFIMVMIADFLEQGVSGFGFYEDDDISLFSYIKLQYWADVINFVSPYLDVMPTAFQKYGLLDGTFKEPSRKEIKILQRLLDPESTKKSKSSDVQNLVSMVNDYPWLPESKVALAQLLEASDNVDGHTKDSLLSGAMENVQDWGLLFLKDIGHVRDLVETIQNSA